MVFFQSYFVCPQTSALEKPFREKLLQTWNQRPRFIRLFLNQVVIQYFFAVYVYYTHFSNQLTDAFPLERKIYFLNFIKGVNESNSTRCNSSNKDIEKVMLVVKLLTSNCHIRQNTFYGLELENSRTEFKTLYFHLLNI